MGQQPSAHSDARERNRAGQLTGTLSLSDKMIKEDSNPYTAYSRERKSSDDTPQLPPTQSLPTSTYPQRGGVTVVNTLADTSWRDTRPIELQKLDKVHRFWPILRSSLESIPPQEKISDGVHYKEILSLCLRYQEHLAEAARVVGAEQKALAGRLKDIEMFSAGIMQQMIRRQENLTRINTHLQKVSDVEQALSRINAVLDSCVPLVRRLNSYLPEEKRLERFDLNLQQESDNEGDADDAVGDGAHEYLRDTDTQTTAPDT